MRNGNELFPTNVDIITWRGILTKILYTPVDWKSEWTMYGVYRNNSTIYLGEKKELEAPTKYQECASYGGFKFESICMVPLEEKSSSNSAFNDSLCVPLKDRMMIPVNAIAYFGIVYRSRLGRFNILASAEVDGVDTNGSDYVELKTQRILSSEKDHHYFFRDKLLKFWLQSYLAGIPRLLLGWRDDTFQLKHLEYINVADIPEIITTNARMNWNGMGLIKFGQVFFEWLKNELETCRLCAPESQNADMCFIVRKTSRQEIILEISPFIHNFIPSWYMR